MVLVTINRLSLLLYVLKLYFIKRKLDINAFLKM